MYCEGNARTLPSLNITGYIFLGKDKKTFGMFAISISSCCCFCEAYKGQNFGCHARQGARWTDFDQYLTRPCYSSMEEIGPKIRDIEY